MQKNFEQNGITDKFKIVLDMIVKTNNPELCFKYALFIKEPEYVKRFEKVVLDSKNPKYCYNFACSVNGADIEALQKVVLDSGDLRCCCNFASNVRGADVKALQKVIEDSKSVRFAYRFLLYVKKANKLPLCKIIIENGKLEENINLEKMLPQLYIKAKMELDGAKQEIDDNVETL